MAAIVIDGFDVAIVVSEPIASMADQLDLIVHAFQRGQPKEPARLEPRSPGKPPDGACRPIPAADAESSNPATTAVWFGLSSGEPSDRNTRIAATGCRRLRFLRSIDALPLGRSGRDGLSIPAIFEYNNSDASALLLSSCFPYIKNTKENANHRCVNTYVSLSPGTLLGEEPVF